MEATDFRAVYPEFADPGRYPNARVEHELRIAQARVSETRWGELYSHGVFLHVAHALLLRNAASQAAQSGGAGVSGPITSKSISKVSVSYDTSSVTLEDAGNYNTTVYGREFWLLAKQFGMGGMQL